MPEVAEPPSTAFTQETAREAGLKSWEATKARNQELENLRTLLATTQIEPPKPSPKDSPAVEREVQRQIDLDEDLITRAYERIKDPEIDDKARAALMREIRGFQEHICRLRRIAQAPTCKAEPRARATRAPVMPIMSVQPTQPVVDGPDSGPPKPTQ